MIIIQIIQIIIKSSEVEQQQVVGPPRLKIISRSYMMMIIIARL